MNKSKTHYIPMKKLILALCLGIPVLVSSQTMVRFTQFVKLNSAADPPVALTNAVTQARRITLVGNKDIRTANTGTVYIGSVSNNNIQSISIASGETVNLVIPEGTRIDLSGLWLDVVTANDGVLVIYE